MLQYLIILLDDTSVSFCHYPNKETNRQLIDLDNLKNGIRFAMKQNLMVQFVYPDYKLPESYEAVIESIDHHKIKPGVLKEEKADVVVYDYTTFAPKEIFTQKPGRTFVLRISKNELFNEYREIVRLLKSLNRLTLVITDIDTFREEDFDVYKRILSSLKTSMMEELKEGNIPQLNTLSDRIQLEEMNNCNAGIGNITLAPNGKFYICPAFYLEDKEDSVGDLTKGVVIPNKQLFKLDYAPICRKCDAYHCKRCVWLNRKTTLEVNTPSHEQCVTAHLERNTSRELLNELKGNGYFPDKAIKEIVYLDPFELKE